MTQKTIYLEDWDTWDLDVHVPCECGETLYLYQPDFVVECDECGRKYMAKVTIDVYLMGADYAVGSDTSDDDPEF